MKILLPAFYSILFMFFNGCGTDLNKKDGKDPNKPYEKPEENFDNKVQTLLGDTRLTCGENSAQIEWKIQKKPELSDPKKFAITLSGSPSTKFFAEDSSQELIKDLVQNDFYVLQIRYPRYANNKNGQLEKNAEGFYSLCYRQGVDEVVKHGDALYQAAKKTLGFDPNNQSHKIIGVGFSIGAIQLQTMSFFHDNRVDNIALTGVLLGDPQKGCESATKKRWDGYSWRIFLDLADSVTKDRDGCSLGTEFSDPKLRFENTKNPYLGKLGLFEGTVTDLSYGLAPGNIEQARYIHEVRKNHSGSVQLSTYNDCGHELLTNCKHKTRVLEDILKFLKK